MTQAMEKSIEDQLRTPPFTKPGVPSGVGIKPNGPERSLPQTRDQIQSVIDEFKVMIKALETVRDRL